MDFSINFYFFTAFFLSNITLAQLSSSIRVNKINIIAIQRSKSECNNQVIVCDETGCFFPLFYLGLGVLGGINLRLGEKDGVGKKRRYAVQ